MKLAHARERNAPAGTAYRLHAALDPAGARWLDLEVARRRAVRHDGRLAHNSVLFRQPILTLDAVLAEGLRVDTLADVLEGFEPTSADDDAISDAADLDFGPPILHPASLRDFYAFERHVGTMWKRRDMPIPEAWFRIPVFYFSNISEIRGPGDPVWAPTHIARARLRAGDRRADRHARQGSARGTRRGGDRRLHAHERLVGARPAA